MKLLIVLFHQEPFTHDKLRDFSCKMCIVMGEKKCRRDDDDSWHSKTPTSNNHEKIIRIWNSNHPTPVPTRHKLSTLSNRLPSHTVDKHSFPYPSRRWRLPVVKSFDFPHISNEQRKPHSREIVIITRRCGKSLTIFLVSLFFVL